MYDVIIVGGGPAALSAALTLGRARRHILLIDGGPGRGDASDTTHNFPTRDGTSVTALRGKALAELSKYAPVRVHPGRAVHADDDLSVVIDDGTRAQGRRLILATGLTDVLPGIDGFADRWGQSVVHCLYCHGWERRDLPIAVLDLGGLGIHQAVQVRRFSDDVVLCTNGQTELTPEQRSMLKDHDIGIHRGAIARLEGPGRDLERIVFADGGALVRRAMFTHPPTRQASNLGEQLGCAMLDDGAVQVNQLGQTTISGVYAAGDMARQPTGHPGHQIVTAAAEGATAAIIADQELLYE